MDNIQYFFKDNQLLFFEKKIKNIIELINKMDKLLF